ncbi:hypothetical protein LH464_05360 [Neorhizobium sp. T786]|uniref:hypothetical protein n=1 Tax=Pseudorhizobium xiangyangii TaxID=2883104 RepID=UPI001CFF787B|nr:hypothetical protein [Neorhizobium xiangyangii]MCB5201906.1 hypothetical protein [Neorhizobium xiangyangii]
MDAFLYRIKAAQRDLIERCGGIMRVVEKAGFSKSEVGRWNNSSEPDLMPIGAIAVLERDCGQALVTAVLAETNGRRLSDPDEERKAEVCVLNSHAELMRQSAELAHSIAVAIADGQVSPSEAQTIDRAASGIQKGLSDLRASLATIKARGGARAGLSLVSGD